MHSDAKIFPHEVEEKHTCIYLKINSPSLYLSPSLSLSLSLMERISSIDEEYKVHRHRIDIA